MRLVDLNPVWWAEAGRRGQGVTFDCPCGCKGTERFTRLAVAFKQPLDGGAPIELRRTSLRNAIMASEVAGPDGDGAKEPGFPGVCWARGGETFETLSVSPSIHYGGAGHWHGMLTNGDCSGGGASAAVTPPTLFLPPGASNAPPANACACCRAAGVTLVAGVRDADGAACLLCITCAAKKAEGARIGYAPAVVS